MSISALTGTSGASGLSQWWALQGDPSGAQPSPLDLLEASYDRSFDAMPQAMTGAIQPQILLDLLVIVALLKRLGDQAKESGALPSAKAWNSGGAVPGGWSGGGNAGGGDTGATTGTGTEASGDVAPPDVKPGDAPSPAAPVDPEAKTRFGNDLVPKQFGGQLSGIEQSSGCGPLAAIGVARSLGMNPDIEDTFNKARASGWNGDGMNGPANYVRLLDKMGIKAHLDQSVSPDAIQKSVESGRPVTISTAKHYFLAYGYDAETGRFQVGNSGTAMRGGKEWMTLDEIRALGGGINGIVYVDR